ncbi:MAG: EAL domain-containing protein [Pseudomonadota bacterium]
MQKTSIFDNVKPYLAVYFSLIAAIALIILSNFANEIALHWMTALWGCLILAILITIGQTMTIVRSIGNYSEQLLTSKERLANEIKHRLWAEKTTSESKIKSQIIDENIPVMLAYFNTDLRCRYHNRIFRRWFGLKPDQIDGRLLQEFSNDQFFLDIENCIEDILTGKTIHNERILKSTKGFPYIFTEQYIPHLDNKGKVIGLYTLHTPRAQEKSRVAPTNKAIDTLQPAPQQLNSDSDKNNAEAVETQASKSGITATRIVQAIENGEFNLYCQAISSVKSSSTPLAAHYEILIRMNEEESNLMPPGSFLPFVEQFKMMPQLDRWVVNHIVEWMAAHQQKPGSVFCLNVAKDTLNDEAFPSFVQQLLQRTQIPAGSLCFEIEERDAESDPESTSSFSKRIRQLGCSVSLCSFSHSRPALDLLNTVQIDYLKIDGSLVCNILRNEEDLEAVISINQLAQRMKIKTIAELVETEETIAKLREIGVDFAQGFGIAKPHPIKDLE